MTAKMIQITYDTVQDYDVEYSYWKRMYVSGTYEEVQSKYSCKEDFRNTIIYLDKSDINYLETFLQSLGIYWCTISCANKYFRETMKCVIVFDDFTMIPIAGEPYPDTFKEVTFKIEHNLSFSEITPKQETIEYAGNIYDKAQFEGMIAKLTKLNENS